MIDTVSKTRILVAGIGGVGGYFGGLLSKAFENQNEVDIYFLARGKHLEAIQNQGLKVAKGDESFIAFPSLATDNPNELPPFDVILLCTKTYDLIALLNVLKPCITSKTCFLPLVNGVDSVEIIKQYYPENQIINGCVYIVSRLMAPGVVENSGNIQRLVLGNDGPLTAEAKHLIDLCKQAEIDIVSSETISQLTWEKFIFISPLATATTYFNCSVDEVIKNNATTLETLLKEIIQVAKNAGVPCDDDIFNITVNKFNALKPGAQTSMQSDYVTNKPKIELESLTGYVVRNAERLGIETPTYNKIYEEIKLRLSQNLRN